jgi:lipid-A-disaccharide synthase
MKWYVIAGEASGDLHGSNLLCELKKIDVNFQCRAWGGDLMEKQGAFIAKHYKELAFMGFAEVVMNLNAIVRNLSFCKTDLLAYQPDALILIDYPGFNLRIAKFAKANNIKVLYYISPTVWAWKKNRVEIIRANVLKMFVILPFEKEFYKNEGLEVEFVGHPLLDAIENYKKQKIDFVKFSANYNLLKKPIVALLPGSRKQEIITKLPIMLSVIDKFKDYQFVIAAAPGLPLSFYNQFISSESVKVLQNDTYSLLQHSTVALVTSGTATLETALFEVPQVVCYIANNISYQIAKRLINIKFISLVNLIMDKEVVKELIQSDLNSQNLSNELSNILPDKPDYIRIKKEYTELKKLLGVYGASAFTAKLMLKIIEGK